MSTGGSARSAGGALTGMADIGCTCTCEMGDGHCDVYESDTPVARKEHWCCECGEVIKVGERYERVALLYDGAWSHHKTCLICRRIAVDLVQGPCCHEGLRETIYECLGFDYVTGHIAAWAEDDA